MAAHSSILAWEIPWTEKSGRLQSMVSQKSWTQLSDQTTTKFKRPGGGWWCGDQEFPVGVGKAI